MAIDKTNNNLSKFDSFIQQEGPIETKKNGSRKFLFEGNPTSLNQIFKEFKRCLANDPNFDPVQANRIMTKFEEWKNTSNYSPKLGLLGKGVAKINHKIRQMGDLFYRRDHDIQKVKGLIDTELHRPAFDQFKKDFPVLVKQYPNTATTPEATYVGMQNAQNGLQIPSNFYRPGTLFTFVDQNKTLWVAVYDPPEPLIGGGHKTDAPFRTIKSYADVDDTTIARLEKIRSERPVADIPLD